MKFKSFAAAAVRTAVVHHEWQHARRLVKELAPQGLVSYQQADKHNGGTAMVLVDGEEVGQASNLLINLDTTTAKQITGYYR